MFIRSAQRAAISKEEKSDVTAMIKAYIKQVTLQVRTTKHIDASSFKKALKDKATAVWCDSFMLTWVTTLFQQYQEKDQFVEFYNELSSRFNFEKFTAARGITKVVDDKGDQQFDAYRCNCIALLLRAGVLSSPVTDDELLEIRQRCYELRELTKDRSLLEELSSFITMIERLDRFEGRYMPPCELMYAPEQPTTKRICQA